MENYYEILEVSPNASKEIIDKAYNTAAELLKTHIDKLHTVAGILLEKEKIDGEEFDQIFN